MSSWGLWGLHEALHRADDGQFYADEYNEHEPEHPDGPDGFWHGTPSGDLRGAHYGLHVGTYKAASEALNARIGKPAEGYWDGTRVYGETPVVSPGAGYGLGPPGDPNRVENPYDAHLPNGKATFSDGTPIPLHFKPAILPVRIKGPMANTPHEPYEDDEANDLMTEHLNQGRTRHGFYYTNDGEGGYLHPKTSKWLTSISAVVPNGDHLEVLDPNWPGHRHASTDGIRWGLHTAADAYYQRPDPRHYDEESYPDIVRSRTLLDIEPKHFDMPADEAFDYGWAHDSVNNYDPRQWSEFEGFNNHVRDHGIQRPLSIVTDGESAYLEDGHHRVQKAVELGHDHVPVRVTKGKVPPHRARPIGESLRSWITASTDGIRWGLHVAGRVALHRGLHVRLDRLGLNPDDPDLVTKLVRRLSDSGAGRHWTSDPKVAKSYAANTMDRDQDNEYFHPDYSRAVVLHGDWGGGGQDTDYESGLSGNDPAEWPDDQETTLYPGSGVHVHSLSVMHPDSWDKWQTIPLGKPMKVTASTDGIRYAQTHIWMHPDDVEGYALQGNPIYGEKMPALKRSIEQHGIHTPLVIHTNGEQAALADGHHRLLAAQELGMDRVPVQIVHGWHDFDDDDPSAEGPVRDWLNSQHIAAVVEADVAEDLRRLAGRPKRIKPPWSDFHNGQAYPLQNQSTADLIHMLYSLRDAHRAGDPPADGVTPFADRIPHYEAELLDRHEAGDPEATRWADRGSYIKPDYMSDAEWQDNLRMYPEDYPVDPRPARFRKPTAAVNQDLVDRLHDEFHDWWADKERPKVWDLTRGPIGEWSNIESFLRERYPAAYRGADYGQEQVAPALDGQTVCPTCRGEGDKPDEHCVSCEGDGKVSVIGYETGADAVSKYGYDPAEIAASFVLLHNKSHHLRGDLSEIDQARLTDIAQKRFQMQRAYENRTAGKNGDLPPLTFEPFNTMWSNGIMARHAEDGRPVGHLHWVPRGEIDSIVVHPELQRRGIGTAMLEHARAHPDQYPSTYPIFHSQNLTKAGRAWAAKDGHTLPDEQVYAADDDPANWGFTAVNQYVPLSERYSGQNEDEMSRYLEQPWTPPKTASTGGDDGWPVWWRGKRRPAGDFDERWSPNHPQRVPAPWES